ncbi:hypothetical protein TNCV_2267411 [Trichonephila clavipes]|nr:hypothetical protein TNCV_2267411 [Trichonephila clavipes]
MRFQSTNGKVKRDRLAEGAVSSKSLVITSVFEVSRSTISRIQTSEFVAVFRNWFGTCQVTAVAEWYRYRTVACLVTSSSPVPLKTRRVGQRCTLNLPRAKTSSRGCGS